MSVRKIMGIAVLGLFLLMSPVAAIAEEHQKAQEDMPEMGPPQEIKELAFLVGDWDVDMKSKWDPADEDWIETKGTVNYKYVAGGSVIQMTYESQVMDMHFSGFGLQCFDRETGQWQMVWSDNFGARISYYEGTKKDGKLVMTGEEKWLGKTAIGRITIYNETDTSFEWDMESSYDGGKTFIKSAWAKYTKRQ